MSKNEVRTTLFQARIQTEVVEELDLIAAQLNSLKAEASWTRTRILMEGLDLWREKHKKVIRWTQDPRF